jgi:hypothetical protein
MKIIDLLADERRRLRWPTPECDAFSDVDALTEASLLDVRMDLINSTVGLMFDCRGALQIRQGNVAVVVIRGVSSCEWASVPRDGRSWRAVMAWQPEVSMTSLTVAASVEPAGRLRVVGTAGSSTSAALRAVMPRRRTTRQRPTPRSEQACRTGAPTSMSWARRSWSKRAEGASGHVDKIEDPVAKVSVDC